MVILSGSKTVDSKSQASARTPSLLETDLTARLNDQPRIRKLHGIRYSRNGIRAISCPDDIGIPVFVAIQKCISG